MIVLVLGIIALLVCMSITPSVAVDTIQQSSIPISNGKTLYVGGSGGGNYTTIQSAIDDANSGDTVFVYNGTYYECFIKIWDGINLIGENKYTTIIDGKNIQLPIIIIEEDNVKISGFTIQKGYEGIRCYSYNNITIEDNIIRNNAEYGICFELGYQGIINNIISNNLITNTRIGILIDGGMSPYSTINITISKNIITNNDNRGILLDSTQNITIRDNNIINNDVGIVIVQSINNDIKDNNITSNNEGILLGLAEWNTIRDNNIINNSIGLNSCNSWRNNITKNNFIGIKINAYFSYQWLIIIAIIVTPNIWDSNYWDNWKGNGPKIIFGGLSRTGTFIIEILAVILEVLKLDKISDIMVELFILRDKPPFTLGRKIGTIPLIQFDRNPAKEPYNIEVVI